MSDAALVVLAAGRARRYGGLKPLAPVGVRGEAVLDLVGADAIAAGFTRLVIVINPETGSQIQSHVASQWPAGTPVTYALQERAFGTVHAVLAAAPQLDVTAPFAVANADDLYGRHAMGALGAHLGASGDHALCGYRLDRAVVGDQPVTRGVCRVDGDRLTSIVERRGVRATDGHFVVDDDLEPHELAPDTRVSMNLWGFAPAIWPVFERAMADAQATEDAEVLLPTTVGAHLDDPGFVVRVLATEDACVGVTHAEDLEIVQQAIRDQVGRGERPELAFG